MGTIFFLLAIVFETAFAVYCIVTQSAQKKVRDWVRVGAFGAFVLLALIAVIHWGFTWYLLALLLLIWAIPAGLRLVRGKNNQAAYRPAGVVVRGIATLLLVFIALIPALVFPQPRLPQASGRYAVATALYSYTDPNRIETFNQTGSMREVNVEFWYPKDAQAGAQYPLVIFSHGTGGMKSSNTSTFTNLASSGYVVCSIDHPYHSLFTLDAQRKMTLIDRPYMQSYLNLSGGKYDAATVFQLESEWMALRTADINFVVDTVIAQARTAQPGTLYALIDPRKIGLMGHSLGGEAAAAVARERAENGKQDIAAVINLDADLHGEYSLDENGSQVLIDRTYPVPLLSIISDSLWRLMDGVPDGDAVIAVKHISATAPNAFLIHMLGTNHMSFTDLPLVSPAMVALINGAVPQAGGKINDPYTTIAKMNEIVLDFCNVYLKGEGKFEPGIFE
jgi:acetyl esterase/lipase